MTPLGQTVHHGHPAPLQASHEGPSAASTNAPAGCNEPDTSHVPALLTAQQLKPKSWGLGAARARSRGRGRRKHAPSRSEMDLSPAGQQRAPPTHPRASRHPSHHGNPSVCTSSTLLVPLSKPAALWQPRVPPGGLQRLPDKAQTRTAPGHVCADLYICHQLARVREEEAADLEQQAAHTLCMHPGTSLTLSREVFLRVRSCEQMLMLPQEVPRTAGHIAPRTCGPFSTAQPATPLGG